MKKGCFLKLIIILTIVVAAILYLVQNKFDEYILKPGKELALSVIENSWKDELNFVKASAEKDSLKSLLKYYVEGLKSSKKLSENNEGLIDFISSTFKDSIIDKSELNIVRELINNTLKNEE